MANIYDLRRRVLLVAKHAPEFIVEEAIFDAAQDLCINAEIWQAMVEVDVSTGDDELMVMAPRGAVVARTMWVNLGGRTLKGMANEEYLRASATPLNADPTHYFQDTASLLKVFPIPVRQEIGQARIVCALKQGETEIPDDIFTLYRETISDGAIYRVLSAPTEFGDVKLSSYYEQKWHAGLSNAKGRATRQKDNRILQTTYGGY